MAVTAKKAANWIDGRRGSRALNASTYFLSGLWPRNPKKLIFGAWFGTKFADNPKYLLLYLAAHNPDLDLVWLGREEVRSALPPNVKMRFVRYGSLASLYETMTAGFCFVTHGTGDLGWVNVLQGAKVIYLGHGVALKPMGTPADVLPTGQLDFVRRLVRKANYYACLVATSDIHRKKLLYEFEINGASDETILPSGQPRNDFLIQNKSSALEEQIRAKLLSAHSIPTNQRIVTYLPTFRNNRYRQFSFLSLKGSEYEMLQSLLERNNAVLLEKSHPVDGKREGDIQEKAMQRIVPLKENARIDTQELLLATDLLITDYSGVYLDYVLLDRPVLHFAYDHEYYTQSDRGLYFKLEDVAAGPVVQNFDELCKCIEQDLQNPDLHRKCREKVRMDLMSFEKGDASHQIIQALLKQ
jgi:CDP-glycerol glycerophosphotransferase (TagB/SpsB family)